MQERHKLIWEFRWRHQHHTQHRVSPGIRSIIVHRKCTESKSKQFQATLTTVLSRSMKKFPTRLKAALLLLCPAMTSSIVKHRQASPSIVKHRQASSSIVKLPLHAFIILYCLGLRSLRHNQVIEMHPNMMKQKCLSWACWNTWHLLSLCLSVGSKFPSAVNWKFH